MSAQGQFHYENVISTAFFFSWGLSGAAQRQTEGSFIRKKLHPLHLFFFDCLGLAREFSEAFGGSRGFSGAYRGQFYWEKVMSVVFNFLLILWGLIDLWIRNDN